MGRPDHRVSLAGASSRGLATSVVSVAPPTETGFLAPPVRHIVLPRVTPHAVYAAVGNPLAWGTRSAVPALRVSRAGLGAGGKRPASAQSSGGETLWANDDLEEGEEATKLSQLPSWNGRPDRSIDLTEHYELPSRRLRPGDAAPGERRRQTLGSRRQAAPWGSGRSGSVSAVDPRAEESRAMGEARIMDASLARFRQGSMDGRAAIQDTLCRGVEAMIVNRRQRLKRQLRDARGRASQLGALLTRESRRAAALHRWGLQGQYVPETALAGNVGYASRLGLASTHAVVMYKALSKAQKAITLRSLWYFSVAKARRGALRRLNRGLAGKIALRGPIRQAWHRWGRFVLLSRYVTRAKTRASAAIVIQRAWRVAN